VTNQTHAGAPHRLRWWLELIYVALFYVVY